MTLLIAGCNIAAFQLPAIGFGLFWQFIFPVFKQIHWLQCRKEARQWHLHKVKQRRNRWQKEFLLTRNCRRKVFLGLLCACLSRGHTVNRTVRALPRQNDLYEEAMNLWTHNRSRAVWTCSDSENRIRSCERSAGCKCSQTHPEVVGQKPIQINLRNFFFYQCELLNAIANGSQLFPDMQSGHGLTDTSWLLGVAEPSNLLSRHSHWYWWLLNTKNLKAVTPPPSSQVVGAGGGLECVCSFCIKLCGVTVRIYKWVPVSVQ